jgi:hypothetical protein
MRLRAITMLFAATVAFGCSDSESPTEATSLEVQFDHDANHRPTPLTGGEEVPTRNTSASGRAIFHIASDGSAIGYELIVSNITNAFQAHIHLAPAGQNGGIVAWLYPSTTPVAGPVGAGRTPDGKIAQGVITQQNLVGALAGQPVSALIEHIRNGNAYVNVHTNDGVAPNDTGPGDFPGGEIRGQIR